MIPHKWNLQRSNLVLSGESPKLQNWSTIRSFEQHNHHPHLLVMMLVCPFCLFFTIVLIINNAFRFFRLLCQKLHVLPIVRLSASLHFFSATFFLLYNSFFNVMHLSYLGVICSHSVVTPLSFFLHTSNTSPLIADMHFSMYTRRCTV